MSQQTKNPEEESRVNESESNANGKSGDYDFTEADGHLPNIDEGPRPGPVDEIQAALLEAAQSNLRPDVELEELAAPDLEEDEVQRVLKTAARQGRPTEVDFNSLPAPLPVEPKKVVTFETKPLPPIAPPPPSQPPEAPPQREPTPTLKPESKPEPVVVDVRDPIPMVPDF